MRIVFSGRLGELVRLLEEALALMDCGRIPEARERVELVRERLLRYDGHSAALVAIAGLAHRLAVLRGPTLDEAVEKVERLADEILEAEPRVSRRREPSRLSPATLDDLLEGW